MNLVFRVKIGIFVLRCSTSCQFMSRKYGCAFISSASPFPDPSRFAGLRCNNFHSMTSYRLQQAHSFRRDVGRKLELRLLDVVEQLVPIVRVVRRLPHQQLVHHHAQQVPIHGLPVPAPLQHLRGQVCHRAAERSGSCLVVLNSLLGQSEVRQHGEPLRIQHDVVRFEVAEDNVPLVQVLERQNHLCEVESHSLLRKPQLPSQVSAQIASWAVVHYQAQLVRGLEGVAKPHDERVLRQGEDVALRERVSSQVLLFD